MASGIGVGLTFACYLILAAPAMGQARDYGLLGDPGGERSRLANDGVAIYLQDAENIMANVAGGIKTGATNQGRTTGEVTIDTNKAFGLAGGTFYVSALQTHGQSLSPFYLDNLQQANSDEGEDQTVLFELWYDQQLGASNLDLKIGQQSIDGDFIVNPSTGLILNTMASWPAVISYDTFDGGPVTPFAAPGLRLRYSPDAEKSYLIGVFDDNPTNSPAADTMHNNDDGGLAFNLKTGAFIIAEFQDNVTVRSLPGLYELGGWYDTAQFPDQNMGTDNLSLADPESNAHPVEHNGNFSLYGVMDQTVWQPNTARHVNLFATLMGAPGPQNLLSFSAATGLTLIDPLPGRENDSAAVELGVAKLGAQAQAFDRDKARFTDTQSFLRGTEYIVELTYLVQATPWFSVQPDFQFIANPSGGIPNPIDPSHRLRNEVVISSRITATF